MVRMRFFGLMMKNELWLLVYGVVELELKMVGLKVRSWSGAFR